MVDFAVPVDNRVKIKENEKRDKYLNHATELGKLWNMKVMVIPTVFRGLWKNSKGFIRRPEKLKIVRRAETIQTLALLSPGDLRRLAVTQTPVKVHQRTLVGKTQKEQKKITIIEFCFVNYTVSNFSSVSAFSKQWTYEVLSNKWEVRKTLEDK